MGSCVSLCGFWWIAFLTEEACFTTSLTEAAILILVRPAQLPAQAPCWHEGVTNVP